MSKVGDELAAERRAPDRSVDRGIIVARLRPSADRLRVAGWQDGRTPRRRPIKKSPPWGTRRASGISAEIRYRLRPLWARRIAWFARLALCFLGGPISRRVHKGPPKAPRLPATPAEEKAAREFIQRMHEDGRVAYRMTRATLSFHSGTEQHGMSSSGRRKVSS